MSQTKSLIIALKAQLKAHGKTYHDVALHLGLSQASVKRMFSENNLSLSRLESICNYIDLPFTDLILSMNTESNKIASLTLEQEQVIADDLLLLLVTVCVINGFTYQDLLQEYELSEHECIQKLAKLDKLKLIELLPGNRFKLKITRHFAWLADGPIQRFFLNRVQNEFFNSRFNKATEKLIVVNGLLSLTSNGEVQKLMQKLCNEFVESRQEDSPLPLSEKHGTTMVLALRQWNSSLFNEIRKSR
ncbi:transcriptional regulator [Psychromonas sp. psych-6C06]|uniref:helix-turn-helix domain-containing protein n=1 Tax=Psychromonas sp. psych-6C06 TaxID=2058089 RepID=UPI000C34DC76|nr:helix-turn-helix transcriptional regulator [Psychromonas sp. psych-6C06]PKF61579.1 transcriptional regulator [Psychromonas sp. psych-6C06]